MKSKPVTEISRHPEGLTFAWLRGDESLVRFWVALLLAVLIFAGAWIGVRVMVPVANGSDRPQVRKAQLLMMNGESHPSLLALMTSQRLPSLGGAESVGEAPLVGDLLQQLGLAEEQKREIILYPAPESKPVLDWPQDEEIALALPELSSPRKEDWPNWGDGAAAQWSLGILASGSHAEVLAGVSLSWQGGEPTEKSSLWWLVFDERGELASALAVGDIEKGAQAEMRKRLQLLFSKGDLDLKLALGSFAGVVELRFEREGP